MVNFSLSKEDELILLLARNVNSSSVLIDNVIDLLTNINWDTFYDKLRHHKIFSLFYQNIKDHVPKEFREKFENRNIILNTRKEYQLLELRKISSMANSRGIPFLLIKGIALSKLIYDDVFSRYSGDLDLLVEDKLLTSLRSILNECNFIHSATNDDIVPANEMNDMGIFHEYWYAKLLSNENTVWAEVKNATSAIPERLIKPFMKNTQSIRIDQLELNTFDTIHTFLHLCANTYGDCEKRLGVERNVIIRDYIDLYVFISKYKKELNFSAIRKLADGYEITHKVYCVFNNLNEIYPNFISRELLQLFNPETVNYAYFGVSNGAVVPWKSTFLQRMFDVNNRIHEYRELCLNRWYSNDNENFNHPYIVQRQDSIQMKFEEIHSYRSDNLVFNYSFTSQKQDISITLLMKTETFKAVEGYDIAFFFMYDTLKETLPSEYKFKWVVFRKESNNFLSTEFKDDFADQVTPKLVPLVKKEEGYAATLNISKEILLADQINKDFLCYNAFIFRKIDQYSFPISIKFSHPDFPEETEHMGVLKLIESDS